MVNLYVLTLDRLPSLPALVHAVRLGRLVVAGTEQAAQPEDDLDAHGERAEDEAGEGGETGHAGAMTWWRGAGNVLAGIRPVHATLHHPGEGRGPIG